MNWTIDDAREFLTQANLFYVDQDDKEEDPEEYEKWKQTLNMNDVWGWACADCETIPDEELPAVAELFWNYGWCGILYWVSERNGQMKSEFHDNNRFIEFVRNEERIRKEVPNNNKRAYMKAEYSIGKEGK